VAVQVYVEPGLGDFGLAWKQGPQAESLVGRAYGSGPVFARAALPYPA
jgi:hypothetical protein